MSWTLRYGSFIPQKEDLREALCTLGNGYFATRGAGEEADADDIHYPGTYLTGGYNRLTTEVAGHLVENEDLVNFPNWLKLRFRPAGGAWFNLRGVDILDFEQTLDIKTAVLKRRIRFRDRENRITSIESRRLVHMRDPHLAAIELKITPEDWSGPIEICSELDGTIVNAGVQRYRELNSKHLHPIGLGEANDESLWLHVETVQSRLEMAQAARTRLFTTEGPCSAARELLQGDEWVAHRITTDVNAGKPLRIEKVVAVHTSRDRAMSEPGLAAREALSDAPDFDELLATHSKLWQWLWRLFDMQLIDSGDAEQVEAQRILRLHILHLLQTVSAHTIDMDAGVPARGLHGEAYRGHIFWDELFIFPFLNFRAPEITRALLLYRYRRLPAARRLAKEAGFEGAMYPWQSGSDGREETQKLHLNPKSGRWLPDNSHLQRHVNLAIAYNIHSYMKVTDDRQFLAFYGAEMMIEIARLFASLATWNDEHERYEIRGVMGPDEYHDSYPDAEQPGLDNNAYTNVMAAWLFTRTIELLDLLDDAWRHMIADSVQLTEEEIERWRRIASKIRVCFHDNGIISQFEGYDLLLEFDWAGYRARYGDIQRLDRILEAEGDDPNRYKLSKQADVLMLFHLFTADELTRLFGIMGYEFDHAMIPRNIAYYLARTSHGSTLSRIVHSWVLARSDRAESWKLFGQALRSDVDDIQGGTTHEGVHLGAMAGTVDIVQRGYSGLEVEDGGLRFDPCLPTELRHLRMNIRFRNHILMLDMNHERLIVRSAEGSAAPLRLACGEAVEQIRCGEKKTFALPPT